MHTTPDASGMLDACFLGPYAENDGLLEKLVVEFLRDHVYWRRNLHPEDLPAIPTGASRRPDFVDFESRLRRELHLLSAESQDRVVPRLTAPRTGTDTPTWVAGRPWPFPDGTTGGPAGRAPAAALETSGRCRAADYDYSVITNPWLCDVPMPAEPKLSLPGLALRWATKSATVLIPGNRFGLTTSTLGVIVN